MELRFEEVYRVVNVGGTIVEPPMIAFGVKRIRETQEDGSTRLGYQYLVANDLSMGHTLWVREERSTELSLEVVDAERAGRDGGSVVWRFEKLTRPMWLAMGDSIQGFEVLQEKLPTTLAVQQYYQQQWLDNGWWENDSSI